MKYIIKMAPQLKRGDKIIMGTKLFLCASGYKQGLGAGSFDFGEYGVIDLVAYSKEEVGNLHRNEWLYKDLPVIVIGDDEPDNDWHASTCTCPSCMEYCNKKEN